MVGAQPQKRSELDWIQISGRRGLPMRCSACLPSHRICMMRGVTMDSWHIAVALRTKIEGD